MRYRPLHEFSKTFYALAEILAEKDEHTITCASKEVAKETRDYIYHFRYALRRTAANGTLDQQSQKALQTLNEFKTKINDRELTLYRKSKPEIKHV